MHARLVLAVGFILALVAASVVVAGDVSSMLRVPEADKTQIITLRDGSTLMGRIKEVGTGIVVFSSQLGDVNIEISKIADIKEIPNSSLRGGRYWFPNPNRTRLYFAPTGRMLKAGQGYFSDIYLFFPSAGLGVTDFFSIGCGISLFPGADISEQLVYINPKVGFMPSEKMALSISTLLIRVPDTDDDDSSDPTTVGILFGTATLGNDDNGLTAGLGYGYADGEMADKPAVLLGGEWRFARRASFVSENWMFPGIDEPLISYGIRFFGEKLSVDLALFNILSEDALFPGVPYVDFVWNF